MKARPSPLLGAAVHAAFLIPLLYSGLQAWTVTAVPKGPNQINLSWAAQSDPGYGYVVEIQSPDDSRYSVFTEMRPIPVATGYTCDPSINWTGKGTGCTISDPTGAYVYNPAVRGIPTWVTEPQYVDPQDGTAVQFISAGLKRNSRYTFRVRTYKGNVAPTYGAYSSTVTATTADYPVRYVSTTGNDANDGSAIDDAHAWRTMGMAASVPCGTLVIAKGGDYTAEYFSLNQVCSPDKKVVLQSNYGQVARITTNSHPDWGSALSIYGTNVVVDGIAMAENGQPDYVMTLNGNHNALFNMNIGPTMIPSGYGGLTIQGSLNLVYGNYIHDFGSPYNAQNPSGGGGFVVELDYGASQNLVWSNHLTRGGHDCTLVHNGASNKFLNNIADGGWGMAFETVYGGSQDNLFEGIVSVNAGALEANIYKPAFELSYKANTVRRSVFMNAGTAMEISAYDDASNNLVYNNVFYNVSRCYFQSHNYGVAAYNGVMVQNNICQYTYDATAIYLANTTPNAISYNNIVKVGGDGSEATVIWNQDAGAPYAYYVTLGYAEANYGNGVWYHNAALSTAPASFVDPANMDFHLNSGSPLRGAGVQVADPNWGSVFGSTVDLGPFGIDLPSGVSGFGTANPTPLIVLTSSQNPSAAGQAVTFTATVSSNLATGTMQFLDGAAVVGTAAVSGGSVSLTTSALLAGSHSVIAVYSGDGNFNGATSRAIAQLVKAGTTVSMASSANPSMAGQPVQLTATVSAAAATGTVQFLDGATLIGTANVASGSAALTTSTLAGGSHSIVAVYSGDAGFDGSTSGALVQMIKQTSSAAIIADTTAPVVGQSVRLTASLSPNAATGTVQFLDGVTVLGTAQVNSGIATLGLSALSLGSHTISAGYSGDASYGSSTSAAITLSVGKANTTVAVNSSLNPAAAGQSVTFTATVSATLATGSIQFLDGATVVGVVAISGGAARLTTAALAAGSHTITAVYSGDGSYNGASSSLSQILRSATSVLLSAPNRSVMFGQAVQLAASLSPGTATGTVQFLDGAVVLATAAVSGGTATLSVSTLTAGTHSLTALYSGDSNNGAGTSPVLTIIVSKANSSVSLSPSQNPSMSGASVTFTAAVSPASATGSVQFLDGSTVLGTVALSGGVAVLSISNLAVGNHVMMATYAGDASLTSSSSPVVTELVNVQTLGAPSQLTAAASSATQIHLSWTASPTAGVAYNVYANATPGFAPSASNQIAVGLSTTDFTNGGLKSATTRYYLVTAQKGNVESAPSNQSSATTRGQAR